MANLVKAIRQIGAVKKASAWLRGKTGPSSREIQREAERIDRLRTNANYRISQMKRDARQEVENELVKKLAGMQWQDKEEMKKAYEKLLEKKSEELNSRVAQLSDEVNLRQALRATQLAVASALRVAGFKDKAEARKVFRVMQPIAVPKLERSALKIALRAIYNDLRELLGRQRAKKFVMAFGPAVDKATRSVGVAEKLEQRNKLYAERLLKAMREQGNEEN